MANGHMKKCSTSLIIREIQIKTTMRYQLTTVRMATLTTQATTDVGKDVGRGSLLHCWWECKLVRPLWKSVEVPQKIRNRTTLRPSNCTTRHLSTGYRCAVSKGHMNPHVYSSTIINSQVWKEPKCPSMDEWIKKMWCIYIQWSIIGNQKE